LLAYRLALCYQSNRHQHQHHMKPNTNSVVAWQSPKLQLIITGLNASANRKTGNMVQSYILRRDIAPLIALATNADKSICGSCPLKGATVNGKRTGRTCYVNVGQGAQQTWNNQSNFAGNTDAITGRVLRLGSYGDPAFVPITVWRKLIVKSRGHTGYTHQWRKVTAQPYREIVMASVESPATKADANSRGWRTFRVMRQNESLQPDEVLCPASEEAGKRTTCENCQLCSGNTIKAKNVAIYAHSANKVNLK
jgi:hypothetical protein